VKWGTQRFRIAFPIRRNSVGVLFTLLLEECDSVSEMLCLRLFQSRDDGDRRRNNSGVSEKVAGSFSHHMAKCSDLTVIPVAKLQLYFGVAYNIYLVEFAV
jgi:hypothetical protein